MSLELDIERATRFVTARLSGVVVLDEILQGYDKLVIEEAMPYRKLFDASTVEELRLGDDDIMTLGARSSAYALLERRGAIAIVAVDDAIRGVARRYINLGGASRPVRLFDRRERALKWLLEQPEA